MDNETTIENDATFPDAIQDQTIETTAADRRVYMRKLEVPITDEERLDRHEQHLKLELQIDSVKAARASEMADFNARLKELRQQRTEYINAIHTGHEWRDVEVYDVMVEELGKIETRRVDTNGLVDERAMTLEERQGQLPFVSRTDGGDDPVTPEDFEPTPEALAQAAEDEGRVVKTTAKEARAKRASKKNGAAETAE